jgi:hypothetical protein
MYTDLWNINLYLISALGLAQLNLLGIYNLRVSERYADESRGPDIVRDFC